MKQRSNVGAAVLRVELHKVIRGYYTVFPLSLTADIPELFITDSNSDHTVQHPK